MIDELEELAGVRFGMLPAELLDARPDGGYDEEGVYREGLNLTTVASYGFLPWESGAPPNGRARLSGVEIRKEIHDSVRLQEFWDTVFSRSEAHSPTAPTCTSYEVFRRRRRTAAFSGARPVTLVAEIIEAGDGETYEAYLYTRVETPEMAHIRLEQPGSEERGRPVDCGVLSGRSQGEE